MALGTLHESPILTTDGLRPLSHSDTYEIIVYNTKTGIAAPRNISVAISTPKEVELSVNSKAGIVLDPACRFLQHRIDCSSCGKGWSSVKFDNLKLGKPTKIVTQIGGLNLHALMNENYKEHLILGGMFYKHRTDGLSFSMTNEFLSFFPQFGITKTNEFERIKFTKRIMSFALDKHESIIIENGNIAMFTGLNYDE